MFSIEIDCPPEQNEMLVAELWAAGSAGIVELEGGGLRAFFEDDADRGALTARFHAVSWRREERRDWVEVSRANWEPLLVGERFFLVPEWRDDAAPKGRFRIARVSFLNRNVCKRDSIGCGVVLFSKLIVDVKGLLICLPCFRQIRL